MSESQAAVVAVTERLQLRHFLLDDAGFIVRLLNSPGFLQYIGDRGVRSLEDARRYLEDEPLDSYRANGFGTYMVETRASGEPVGTAGLTHKPWLQAPDLAYAFLPEAQGQGYASEAARAILEFARDSLHRDRVQAVVIAANAGSIRVLRKLGFAPAGFVEDPRDGAMLKLLEWVAAGTSAGAS